ncbi:ferritin-like domain-containing protein [Baekduia soli]|uniref:Ferritin-like domain-containing protein n=1 Tax=Baekduia soli TaxID=496014 RepID=A0A5B8U7V1_9ACTN|nr:ferritin-like domain-containing protein [Baekduia soli]QEC49209.1 ferritin-like domain-containing protein [Baekduia soli]
MSEELEVLHKAVLKTGAPEHSRRKFMMGAAGALGGMGLIGSLPSAASAATGPANPNNTTQTILNVAATAEVLATIVNTLGYRRPIVKDKVTRRNIGAAAQEELAHYNTLIGLGATPLTKRIWVPNAVLASQTGLLTTLVAGDQIFVNAYLIGVGAFAKADPKLAAVPAEFMGAEAVHRALALQSLGQLGNDRIYMKVDFTDILDAVKALQAAGFGFGAKGAKPGQFFDFDDITPRTPTFAEVNTPDPTPIDA